MTLVLSNHTVSDTLRVLEEVAGAVNSAAGLLRADVPIDDAAREQLAGGLLVAAARLEHLRKSLVTSDTLRAAGDRLID